MRKKKKITKPMLKRAIKSTVKKRKVKQKKRIKKILGTPKRAVKALNILSTGQKKRLKGRRPMSQVFGFKLTAAEKKQIKKEESQALKVFKGK